jgi:GT2 family glycosyltransferase
MDKLWPRVAVVVLNYNTKNLLEKFVPLLLYTAYPNVEMVVADNASNDGSAQWLSANYPQIRLIQIPENRGYAGGYNYALKLIKADYFVLLNSDVEVPPGWLMPLVQTAKRDDKIGAIQPKIKDFVDRTKFEYAGAAGGYMDRFGYPFCKGRLFDLLENDEQQFNVNTDIFWASGAALFVKAEVYQKIGGLDEHFFAHMEEIDLCWRMKSYGYKVHYCNDSEVFHMGGGTLSQQNSRKTYLNFRNGLRLIIKNYPKQRFVRVFIMRLFMDGLAGLRFLSKGKFKDVGAIIKAHWHVFGSLNTWLKYRSTTRKMDWETFKDTPGFYNKSTVWQFFAKGKKTVNDLPKIK